MSDWTDRVPPHAGHVAASEDAIVGYRLWSLETFADRLTLAALEPNQVLAWIFTGDPEASWPIDVSAHTSFEALRFPDRAFALLGPATPLWYALSRPDFAAHEALRLWKAEAVRLLHPFPLPVSADGSPA